jgi:hypothetical protein
MVIKIFIKDKRKPFLATVVTRKNLTPLGVNDIPDCTTLSIQLINRYLLLWLIEFDVFRLPQLHKRS